MTAALNGKAVRQHLIDRGLLTTDAQVDVVRLSGGVSSDIVAVSGAGIELVVKRALPRLLVAEEWLADSGRVVTEARALRIAAALTPDSVPAVLDLDEETNTLVLSRASPEWENWRDGLLVGRFDDALPAALGAALGCWHANSSASPPADLTDTRVFSQLRIDPFYRSVAERHPGLAPQINATADALLATPKCLVHGDLSPKNVLHLRGRFWVVDWETAHVGDPCFDLAHLLTHLFLKAVHRSVDAHRYRYTAEQFLGAYTTAVDVSADDQKRLIANLGCLLLARVDGKSPAPYLLAPEQARVRALGLRVLSTPPRSVQKVWELM